MTKAQGFGFCLAWLLLLSSLAPALSRPSPKRIQIAEDVFVFTTPAYGDVFRVLLGQGRQARERGVDVEQAKEAIVPGLRGPMVRITRDDPALNGAFRVQLVDWYLHRVYDELAGPLTDEIAPIPTS